MSVPESIAWLENAQHEAAHGGPHGATAIYASTILAELKRLSEALDICAREVELREGLRADAVTAHRALEATFDGLEQKSIRAREEWDRDRTDLQARQAKLTEKLQAAEGMLKDTHFALLHQPELTREEIATAILSVVTPHPEGAKS